MSLRVIPNDVIRGGYLCGQCWILLNVLTQQEEGCTHSMPIEQFPPSGMAIYAGLCGWTLARAHARSGDRVELAAYLGSSDKFDNAIADFAETYADQNERDHGELSDAVRSGRAEARAGL